MSQKRRRARAGEQSNYSQKRARPTSLEGRSKKTDYDYITKHDYVILDDLMFVRPYVFEFRCYFKPRWLNRNIFDVFVDEFHHAGREYWKAEFSNGHVLCNGRPMGEDAVWNDGMEVVHIVHRHESAVLSTKIDIAVDEEGYVVVSKPPSMPVHPCGTYRRNCLQFVLRAFHGYDQLLCVHRLDKETSGLVILAKNAEYAARFSEEIKTHRVLKTYLAEVHGMFPDNMTECTQRIFWDKRKMRAFVRDNGLDAQTSFKVVGHNKRLNTTIIECKPLTGRTHQIRVHLAYLGYPIINDPLYSMQHTQLDEDDTSTRYRPCTNRKLSSITLDRPFFKEEGLNDETRPSNRVCEWSQRAQREHRRQLTALEEGKLLHCSTCPQVTNTKNVGVGAMFIHLHALKYESDNWSFQVAPPAWVREFETEESGKVVYQKNPRRMLCNIS